MRVEGLGGGSSIIRIFGGRHRWKIHGFFVPKITMEIGRLDDFPDFNWVNLMFKMLIFSGVCKEWGMATCQCYIMGDFLGEPFALHFPGYS